MWAYTLPKLARETGLPLGWLRRAVEDEDDPLPCVRRGGKRPIAYVRWDAFEEWFKDRESD